MNSRIAPYQLQEGLFLEKRRALLEWKATPMELAKTADKKTIHWDQRADLRWLNEEVMGGLPVHVARDALSPDYFSLGLAGTFPFKDAREFYDFLLPILVERLGEPQLATRIPDYPGYPTAEWTFGEIGVAVLIYDRFGPNFAFSVSNSGLAAVGKSKK
jgi:hypothetical protein